MSADNLGLPANKINEDVKNFTAPEDKNDNTDDCVRFDTDPVGSYDKLIDNLKKLQSDKKV